MIQENEMIKRCIFHIPKKLEKNGKAASQLRPVKMIKAFENIGYKVTVISGTAIERKRKIKRIKKRINNGVQYDFMYSESNTLPTLLTENHHLPTHPFFEFHFFYFLKKHNVKIGLFYRDIYWKFSDYKESVKGIKYYGAVCMYKYDLLQYNKSLTKFYLPTRYCKNYLAGSIKEKLIDYLPPGCDNHEIKEEINKDTFLKLLYVGGIGHHYRIHRLVEAVKELKDIKLTICCHEAQWKDVWKEYDQFQNENIEVVHKKENELEELYVNTDICILFLEPCRYAKMAMPYKTFEYLGHGCPIIGTKETAAGEYIEENKVGWSMPYHKEEFSQLIKYLQRNPEEIKEKKMACIKTAKENRWEERAKKVVQDLKADIRYETKKARGDKGKRI